ncbi:MAG: acylphosphatase [Verrucomicrobia bacterium]|nr:acylphosphatase [Verrucomicrobiota bacterium]
MIAKKCFFEGRVQGVGFRFSAKELAAGFDVTGYVRNLIDGRVELEVQGEESEVDAFLEALRESHLRAHISRRTVQPAEVIPGRKGFSIR